MFRRAGNIKKKKLNKKTMGLPLLTNNLRETYVFSWQDFSAARRRIRIGR